MSSSVRLGIALLGALALVGAAAPGRGEVSPLAIAGTEFVDASGARILLRGFAIQAKMPPFRPVQSAADFDPIRGYGANVVRLHFSWEAAELVEGTYDESYFDYYRQVVDWAAERDLYVIIDFHNNAFSRWAANGCGSGFPPWAISPAVPPVPPKPNGECVFNEEMARAIFLGTDNERIWVDFLEGSHGARSRFFALTARLAQEYAAHPNVIGFDLNEPLPWNTSGGGFDHALMTDFYEQWAAVIHAADPGAFVFVEPFFIHHILFNVPTLYEPFHIDNAVYAPHYYEFGTINQGRPILPHAPSIESIVASRQKLGIPVFVGEWGGPMGGLQAIEDQLHLVVRDFDRHRFSGVRWNYSPNWTPEGLDHFHDEDYSCFDDQRLPRPGCFPRAFAPRTAGIPLSSVFLHRDESLVFHPLLPELSDLYRMSGTFLEHRWLHDPSMGATVLFAPVALLYDAPPRVATSPGLTCEYDPAQTYLSCRSDQPGVMRVLVHPQ